MKPLFSDISVVVLAVCIFGTVHFMGCGDSEEPEPDPVVSIVCDDTMLPLIGFAPEECFIRVNPKDTFYVFRGEVRWVFDLDQDGRDDVELIIDDRSFGIAGPTRATIELVALQEEYTISNSLVRSEYCRRWWSAIIEQDTIPFYGIVDSRPCMFYTAEELMEYDTFSVEVYEDYMVDPYELGDEISPNVNWSGGNLLVTKLPTQRGNVRFDESNFLLFRREIGEEVKYG